MSKKIAAPANKNDEVVFALQEQIKKKKAQIKGSEKFAPITNCSLSMDGERFNLNAIDLNLCKFLLAKMNALVTSANNLQLGEVIVSGFSINDWEKDLRSKAAYLGRKTEEAKLKKMEDKLQQLLSQEARVSVELDAITKELGLEL